MLLTYFGKYAGPKLNVEKTQDLAFGKFAKHESVKWPTDNIKALGVLTSCLFQGTCLSFRLYYHTKVNVSKNRVFQCQN